MYVGTHGMVHAVNSSDFRLNSRLGRRGGGNEGAENLRENAF